ncbi:titin isoform X1 [Seriola aureovittata]|uniref:titin isoform X1 n=2 Tax=Seriola aureovittata TaxID=2871759 RepID=UPI0024BE660F|nr:titin isoform X1 [Seriola aureovittata]
MTQLRNTASIGAAQWKMYLIKVFCVIYFTAVCAAQDPEDATEVYRSSFPTTVVPEMMPATTVYKPAIPSLQQQSAWLEVFPSEKVELSCVSGSSDLIITWYKNQELLQDADPNVSISADGSVLTITAATQMAGSYICKVHHKTKGGTHSSSNSLEVKVYANNPKLTMERTPSLDKMYPGESVTFTCSVKEASGWEYLWSHNGSEIQAQSTSTYVINTIDHSNNGQYHCKAKRGKDPFYTEEGKTSLQVSDPPAPSLTLESTWRDVFEDELVLLKCGVGDSTWKYIFYKNEQQLSHDSLREQDSDEDGLYLNITSVTQADKGEYACKAQHNSRKAISGFSNRINIMVYENTPEPTVSKDPDFNPMYVGETVNFTCNVAVASGWSYWWYKDGNDLSPPTTSKTISIPLSLSDGGEYSCQATRSGKTSTNVSAEISQEVREIPVPSLKNLTQWLDVFPTESVKLSCRMAEGTGWKHTWYKDGQKVQADNTVSFDSDGATLSISAASVKHAGKYTCMGHLQDRSVRSSPSSELTLTVYDKKPSVTLTQDPEYKVMFPEESVSFSCHINVSTGWEYLWYKDATEIGVSEKMYSINSVKTLNGGSYRCKAKRGRNQVFVSDSSQEIHLKVQAQKPKTLMTRDPDVNKVYAGELVSFKCKVPVSSGWEYQLVKNGKELSYNSGFTIHKASSSDSGTYECKAKRDKSTYYAEHSGTWNLQIVEIPVPSLKMMTPWLDVFPSESVKLGCRMDGSSDWTYIWSKDGQKQPSDNSLSFDSDQRTLSISSASASHRGQYTCSAKLKSRSVFSTNSSGLTLRVYDTKPRVTLMQHPEHDVMHTEDSVSFSCHINVSSGWEYLWYKDGTPLAESENSHNISSVVTANTGSYSCQVKRGTNEVFQSDQSQAVRLNVNERPQAHIILLTGWSEVFATDSLVLKCEVRESKDMWNYTWFKEGKQIDLLHLPEKHTVTPQNDPNQSLYTCYGVRNGRPSYSKRSDSFKTKSLLLKRRLLLAISGLLFFGLIAVFLGCIVLRVFRKPADDDDKPEEENLFLTMAQMKDRTDAPCPLVEYITDASLNEPCKEVDENGTSCSETTPLPITTQEDKAVTTESTEENNGGLVSFKQ